MEGVAEATGAVGPVNIPNVYNGNTIRVPDGEQQKIETFSEIKENSGNISAESGGENSNVPGDEKENNDTVPPVEAEIVESRQQGVEDRIDNFLQFNEQKMETTTEIEGKISESIPKVEGEISERTPEVEGKISETTPEVEGKISERTLEVEEEISGNTPEVEGKISESTPEHGEENSEMISEVGVEKLVSEPEIQDLDEDMTPVPSPECVKEPESETRKKFPVMGIGKRSREIVPTACTSVEVFKTPEVPILKKKRKVLEEDKYAIELEKIIQRDYFPDLEKLKAQNAYLNALENNDIHMLRELYSKYSFGMKSPIPNQRNLLETPSTFETPLGSTKQTPTVNPQQTPTHLPMESPSRHTDDDDKSESGKSTKSKGGAKNMTLNTFLDNYTSEDNQSFQDIMEESDRKHKIKFAWLYDAEKDHAEKLKASLAVPSIQEQADGAQKPLNIDTWGYKNQNYIMYVPDGVAFTPEEQVQLAKKKAEVVFKNTRFKETPFKEPNVPDTPGGPVKPIFKNLEGRIGVDGKEVENETPKVNGFSYVRTPSPQPGVNESPLMTWGEIEGTPFRLDGGDTPVPVNDIKPFRMLEQSKREKIAIELAEKVSQRYRDKKQKAIEAARSHLGTPSPRVKTQGVLDRLSSMSPAAQKFAKCHLGSRLTSDRALRASYTPSRASTPSSLKTPTLTPGSRTPRTPMKTPVSTSKSTPSLSTLTDNLLQLPHSSNSKKRTKASEFF